MNPADLPWKQLRKNVFFKSLAKDKQKNFQIDLIRLEPKITFAEHLHPEVEWVYILKGGFKDERGSYKKGDFVINEKNSKHIVTSGPKGCEILCCWCGRTVPTK